MSGAPRETGPVAAAPDGTAAHVAADPGAADPGEGAAVPRLHARVLLDTGPDRAELAHVRCLFAEVGVSVEVEGHSYGGPPPTSMFFIVVSVPLVAFIDRFAVEGTDGQAAFASLLRRLHEIRADPRRWGRPHTVTLEDAWSDLTIRCPADLHKTAYPALLNLDLSGFGPDSPPVTVRWNDQSSRWVASLATGPYPLSRRLPTRRRLPGRAHGVGRLTPAELNEVRALVDGGTGSAIRWQRAYVVLLSALGWNVAAIARKTLLSPARIRSLIENVGRAGLAALDPGCAGERTYRPDAEQTKEALEIAAVTPAELGVDAPATGAGWNPDALAEYLVRTGVVEDVTVEWLAEVVTLAGVTAGR